MTSIYYHTKFYINIYTVVQVIVMFALSVRRLCLPSWVGLTLKVNKLPSYSHYHHCFLWFLLKPIQFKWHFADDTHLLLIRQQTTMKPREAFKNFSKKLLFSFHSAGGLLLFQSKITFLSPNKSCMRPFKGMSNVLLSSSKDQKKRFSNSSVPIKIPSIGLLSVYIFLVTLSFVYLQIIWV